MNLLSKLKFRGGLLPLAVALSLVLAVICGAFILAFYYHNILCLKYRIDSRLVNNTLASKEFILAQKAHFFPYGRSIAFDLYDDNSDSVLITRKKWGAFDLYNLDAFIGKHHKNSAFLLGSKKSIYPNVSIFVADIDGTGLTLIGNTKIVGDVLLPKQGVRAGFLNTQGFAGPQLVYGKVEASQSSLPSLSDEFLLEFKELIANKLKENNALDADSLGLVVNNSFAQATKFLCSNGDLVLDRGIYSGNIVIWSNSEIVVTSQCQLDNVILVAPKVIVKQMFSGSLQVFANESIEIESNVKLKYPSVLVCENGSKSHIGLAANSELEGAAYLINTSKAGNTSWGTISVDRAVVWGQIVSFGNVELKGKVFGQILCTQLIYKDRFDKNYTNYLVDSDIDFKRLPNSYLYPSIFDSELTDFGILIDL